MVNFFIKCLFGCIDNLGEERKNNKLRFFFFITMLFSLSFQSGVAIQYMWSLFSIKNIILISPLISPQEVSLEETPCLLTFFPYAQTTSPH